MYESQFYFILNFDKKRSLYDAPLCTTKEKNREIPGTMYILWKMFTNARS